MWKWLFAPMALPAAMVMAAPASAATVQITGYDWVPGLVNGDVTYLPGRPGDGYAWQANGVGIGRFQLTGTQDGVPTDFFTYCADIFTAVGTGTFTLMPANGVISAGKVTLLSALLSNANPLLDAATGDDAIRISAATQMAVWEILNESGAYSLSAGDFLIAPSAGEAAATALFLAARTTADQYLALVTDAGPNGWRPSGQLQMLVGQTAQNQIFLSSVPEPATWLMMILGFGMVGGVMRRRPAATVFA